MSITSTSEDRETKKHLAVLPWAEGHDEGQIATRIVTTLIRMKGLNVYNVHF